ncbi:SAC3/GANP/Nin1/mts3/eIF-3 p25 family-domain-containing protein [Xylogone sp. PMI_703]|nr:SAC3/GANP/Nin1/mts3/eIF-3 p25 family-domain-containing protein [Xylogone sp. PMI_703]
MLLRGSGNKSTRGQSSNRSRGARGRGSTSRGASSSSSPALPISNNTNAFEQERLKNATKREQLRQITNGTTSAPRGAKGSLTGPPSNKQVKFAGVEAPKPPGNALDDSRALPKMNPFALQTSTSSMPALNGTALNPFNAPFKPTTNPFAPSGLPQANAFGAPSQPSSNPFNTNNSASFPGTPPKNVLGPSSTPLGSGFGAPSGIGQSNPFVATSLRNNGASNIFSAPSSSSSIQFGTPSANSLASDAIKSPTPQLPKLSGLSMTAHKPSPLAEKMAEVLRKEGIIKPSSPTQNLGDPKHKSAVESFWQQTKTYRNKVRASLIRSGYLDDPDKPKKLSEAIDFKGTCEDMCPEFEKITRIVEHDVQNAEKERAPDGSLWPSPAKMVKALARSAAGQDAPLPMDVRSPAALKRTLDYLIHTVLGDETELPSVHGFLWDRTRAIRRDFVFQSSMSPAELHDQVYCLERITRFHVIALHHMSKDGIVAEDFSEQQEVEQLGKALLSLIHAYEDCQAQGISCENESEFRAYYVLFNSHNSGILETVQDWGWRFWGGSEEIKIAVSLVETLQNTWDTRGPLKPHSATDVALNAYSRFFSIVQNPKVSYTMACFAEVYFNSVRKSVLKTILVAYRKQRDQTKDWTLRRLNAYLHFDNESEIIAFGEAYGLQFDDIDGEQYLSLDSDDQMVDPFPPLKQPHSYCLVEKKRGNHSLPEVIDATLYDTTPLSVEDAHVPESPFVVDNYQAVDAPELAVSKEEIGSSSRIEHDRNASSDVDESLLGTKNENEQTSAQQIESTPKPLFNWNPAPKSFDELFGKPATTVTQPSVPEAGLESHFPVSSTVLSQPLPSTLQPITSEQVRTEESARELPSAVPLPSQSSKGVAGGFPLSGSFNSESSKTSDAQQGQSTKVFQFPSIKSNKLEPPGIPNLLGSLQNEAIPQVSPFASLSGKPSPTTVSGSPETGLFDKKQTDTPEAVPEQKSNSLIGTELDQVDLSSGMRSFSNWVALGDDGLIDQFTSYMIKDILEETYLAFVEQVERKRAKKAERQARKEADLFRYRSLATKYGHLWRENAHHRWLRRKGREARQARREMAESLKASKAAESNNLVEGFRQSARNSQRDAIENGSSIYGSSYSPPYAGNDAHIVADNGKRKVVQNMQNTPSSTSSPDSPGRSHKRVKSNNAMRRSLLSDPSYLTGGSRIHLLPNYTWSDENRRQISGVQTNYFRLKARGITTLPDGTPLATSVAREILPKQRSFDNLRFSESPSEREQQAATDSITSRTPEIGRLWIDLERGAEMQKLKENAKAHFAEVVEPKDLNYKRSFADADEEELFAKAKRIREQMDEGARWYRTEIERETRSTSRS